jgi:hypothetical protein
MARAIILARCRMLDVGGEAMTSTRTEEPASA